MDNINSIGVVDFDWISIFKAGYVREFLRSPYVILQNDSSSDEGLLNLAKAFLCGFVQVNITGPELSSEFTKLWVSVYETYSENGPNLDCDDFDENIKYPEFLMYSKTILTLLKTKYSNSIVINWWMLRTLSLYIQVVNEITPKISKEFQSILKNLLLNNTLDSIENKILLDIEIANGFLLLNRPQKCQNILENTCSKYNIKLIIKGLLGYRTKHQKIPLPQLSLQICFNAAELLVNPPNINTGILPVLIKNDDDVRLDEIKYCNKEDNYSTNLPNIIQTLILIKLKCLLQSQPKSNISSEEITPYIRTLLNQKEGPFSVRITTLFINISQEATHNRTVERSLKQCEEIVRILSAQSSESLERFNFVFGTGMPPQWLFTKQLGSLLVSLGYYKTALDVFLKVKAWDDVIDCYKHMNLNHKAADIISQQIKNRPSVKLYCLMGDVSNNPEYYEKAWVLSNKKSARAQKHWGNFYFEKKQYKQALPHLIKSVELNSLQENQWLRLGFTAIKLENWKLAVHAYLRYTHLEPHGFESWNNLAKALIKLGEKNRAHKILKESLKCNYNNWKVWENFMAVCIDTRNFEDALNAYIRLVDLKDDKKFLDFEVLEIIITEIIQLIVSPDKQNLSFVKKATLLLNNQCIMYPNEWRLWKLASDITFDYIESSLQLLKGLRAFMQNERDWMHHENTLKQCLNLCLDLCHKSTKARENPDFSKLQTLYSLLASTRLITQSCIRCVQNRLNSSECDNLVLKLERYYEDFTTELHRYKQNIT